MDQPRVGEHIELVVSEDTCVLHLRGDEVFVVHHAGHHRLWMRRSDERLVFVGLDHLPVIELEPDRPLPFADPSRNTRSIRLEGAAYLRVGDPVAFYHAFLRNTLELQPDDLERTAAALLRASTSRTLQQSYGSCDEIEPDLRALAEFVRGQLEESLRTVGFSVDQLEFTRMEIPPPAPMPSGMPNAPGLASVRGRR
jgi:hypothetical protein